MKALRALLLLAAYCALPLAAQESPIRILPANPQAGEHFAVIGAYGYNRGAYFANSTATVSGGVIEMSQPRIPGSPRTQRWSRYGATVGGLAAGAYTVRGGNFFNEFGVYGSPPGTPPYEFQITVSAASAATPRYRDLDGNYFDPLQPGWGVNVVQGDSGALFGVWMTYQELYFRADGAVNESEWLAIPAGRWVDPTTFRGLLYQSAANRPGFGPYGPEASPVGLATFEFLSAERVRFSIVRATLIGTWFERQWILQRFAF